MPQIISSRILALFCVLTISVPLRASPSKEVFVQEACFSPDSKYLSLSARVDGQWDIFITDIEGKLIRNITNDTMQDVYTTWASGGSGLIFVSKRDGMTQLFIHNINDGSTIQWAKFHNGATAPSCSPDFSQIVFASKVNGAYDLFVMNNRALDLATMVGDTPSKAITTDSIGQYNPVWSPDGTKILFYGNIDKDNDELFIINPDGSNLRRLTRTPYREIFPGWAPDSKSVVYSANVDSTVGRLYLLALDSLASPRLLLKSNPEKTFFARISPDGKHIAYRCGGYPNANLYIIASDESDSARIVFGKGSVVVED